MTNRIPIQPSRNGVVLDPFRTREQHSGSGENFPASMAIEGLIIVDENFDLVALDSGAEAILSHTNGNKGRSGRDIHLPHEVVNFLNARPQSEADGTYHALEIGEHEYICRLLFIRSLSDAVQPMLALYFKRELAVIDAVRQATAEYNLTEREQETLIGVTMGLTSKEVAKRMDISPNTVKAFLRLIMIKMGVPTRAGIVGRLLDQNALNEQDRRVTAKNRVIRNRADHREQTMQTPTSGGRDGDLLEP